ncbi:MAG: hypothetical protein IPJ65_20270 [Archangiaceae bacterium]|nr:hypothetical protein [Archangiaceae bacterium]
MRRLLCCALLAAGCADFAAAEQQYCQQNPAACSAAAGGGAGGGSGGATAGGSGGATAGGSGGATAGGSAGGDAGGSAGGVAGGASGGTSGGTAGPGACSDGMLGADAGETDVDCGGLCPPCDVDRSCVAAADCQTGSCQNDFCALVSGGVGGEPTPAWSYAGLFDLGASRTESNARDAVGVARAGARFYLAGGNITVLSGSFPDRTSSRLLTYDAPVSSHPGPLTGVSTFNAAMSATRGAPGAAMSPNGRFFVFGGYGGTGAPNSTIVHYAPDAWDAGPNLPGPAYAEARVFQLADGGALLVASGAPLKFYDFNAGFADAGPAPTGNARAAAMHPNGDLYLFANDPAHRSVLKRAAGASAWQTVSTAPLAQPRAVATWAPDGRFYVVGGSPHTTVQAYRPGADWAAVASTNEGHSEGSLMTGEDGRLYVFFGSSAHAGNEYGRSNRVEVYGPSLVVSPTAAPVGTTARLSGDNFAANATVRIYWGDVDGGLFLRTTTTSDAGTFTNVGVAVPGVDAGRFSAVDSRARYPAFIPFTPQ